MEQKMEHTYDLPESPICRRWGDENDVSGPAKLDIEDKCPDMKFSEHFVQVSKIGKLTIILLSWNLQRKSNVEGDTNALETHISWLEKNVINNNN